MKILKKLKKTERSRKCGIPRKFLWILQTRKGIQAYTQKDILMSRDFITSSCVLERRWGISLYLTFFLLSIAVSCQTGTKENSAKDSNTGRNSSQQVKADSEKVVDSIQKAKIADSLAKAQAAMDTIKEYSVSNNQTGGLSQVKRSDPITGEPISGDSRTIDEVISFKAISTYTDNNLEDYVNYEIQNNSNKAITAIEILSHNEYSNKDDEVVYKGLLGLQPGQKKKIRYHQGGVAYVKKVRFKDGTSWEDIFDRQKYRYR